MKLNKQIPPFTILLNYQIDVKMLFFKNTSSVFLKHVSWNSLRDQPSMLTVYVHLTSLWCKNDN